ncbi:MAG: ATP synthase subunit C [Gammaproteobacteria bacterium]|jgi:V/A-type H+-transporting ATPase subunit K|nr:ATP synthase subunit C [Gammaproteobacteria bacterium]
MKMLKTPLVVALLLAVGIPLGVVLVLTVAAPALAAEAGAVMSVDPEVMRWGLLAGAAAASISALAAGYAVAQVGTAAVGVLAEKPELIGRVLILVGLAEGIAIYGLIVAILIFNRLS